MVRAAKELTPGTEVLSSLWSTAAPTVIGEPAGPLQEVRALGEIDDGTDAGHDTFTGAGPTTLNGRLASPVDPGNGAWSGDTSFEIVANVVETDQSSGSAVVCELDVGIGDCRLSCDITWGHADGANSGGYGYGWNGVTLRGDGASTYLVFAPYGAPGTRTFALFTETGTVVDMFYRTSIAATVSGTGSIEIDCIGDRLKFKIDGIEIGSTELEGTDATTYANTNTEFGIWSNENLAASVGRWDEFRVKPLDAIDTSGLQAAAVDVERYFGFRPFTPPDGAVFEFAALEVRQNRSGAGLWSARLGVLDDNSDVTWAAPLPPGYNVPTDSSFADRVSAELVGVIDGRSWSAFDPTTLFVRLLSITDDPDAAFGTSQVSRVLLHLRYNTPPTVTLDAVDVTASNPVVSWTYTDAENDPQQSYEVRVFDPAVIAANPGEPLEDLTALYESGRRAAATNRSHRIDQPLTPGTLLTFAVRVYQDRVNGSDLVSDWSTLDATTATALGTVPAVASVASVGQIELTIDNLGAATSVNIERRVDAGDFELIRLEVPPTTDRTRDSFDSFDRANGALGNEESTNSHPWTVDTGSGSSTAAIVSNGAEIDGDGGATIPLGRADAAARAVVDITTAAGGVRLRAGATGEVDAVVDADQVSLLTFDNVGAAHVANTVQVDHDEPGPLVSIELIAAGDDYLVMLNGKLHIANTDATVPSKAETAAGITSGSVAGTHRIESVEFFLLDQEVVYVDTLVPIGPTIDYQVAGIFRHAGESALSSAQVLESGLSITEGSWRLRDPILGTSLAFNPEALDVVQDRPGEIDTPVSGGVTANFGTPLPRTFTMSIRTMNETDYDTLVTLLGLVTRLTLTDIFGNAYTVRNASAIEWTHVVSEPEPGETYAVRHHHIARVTFQEVQ